MAMKAEAYREYREAAMVEMLLDTLPKVGWVFHWNTFLFIILFELLVSIVKFKITITTVKY